MYRYLRVGGRQYEHRRVGQYRLVNNDIIVICLSRFPREINSIK